MPGTTTRKEYTEEELEAAINAGIKRHIYINGLYGSLVKIEIVNSFKILLAGLAIEPGDMFTYESSFMSDGTEELYVYRYVRLEEDEDEDGFTTTYKIEPIAINGRMITARDFEIYAAQYDADRAGNYDLSLALLELTTACKESTAERLEVTLYGGKLNKRTVNRSYAYKALAGIELIPYMKAEEGFTYRIKNGNQIAELTAHPDKCAAFIRHKNANRYLIGSILETAGKLLSLPDAKEHMVAGRVWITTNRLIEEIAGKSLTRSTEYRQTIIDGLLALSSAQETDRGPDGKLIYSGYILPVEYREEVFDKQGNSIKDVWGFYPGGEAMAFYKAMESGNATTKLLRLENGKLTTAKGKLNATEAWLVDFLKSTALSELRDKLYPKRGKGLNEFEQDYNLFELFKAYHIPSEGNIDIKTKNRIIYDLETVLKSLALEEAQNNKPVYIKAWTTKKGRSWEKLYIKGYKTYKKDLPKVELGATSRKKNANPKKAES